MNSQDRLPTAPEGFAWVPCTPSEAHYVQDVDGSWSPGSSDCAEEAVRLMRWLGPGEAPWAGCRLDRRDRAKSTRMSWLAPVRFAAGKVPDFGETGLRVQDAGEEPRPPYETCHGCSWEVRERDRRGCEEHRGLTPITLPPLPKAEVGNTRIDTVGKLYAEVERLEARLREAEAERDEAYARVVHLESVTLAQAKDIGATRAELGRVREAAHCAMGTDGQGPSNPDDIRVWVERYESALRRIADGEV